MSPTPTLDSGARSDLTIEARFRGVVVDHATLRHRTQARRRDRYDLFHRQRASDRSFALVEDTPAGLRVNLAPDMRGSVATGALHLPLATWRASHGPSFALPADVVLELSHGQMEYRLAWEAPPPPVRASLVRLRWKEQRYTAGTALAFLLVLLACALTPPDARALSLQRLTRDFRLLPLVLVPPDEQVRARARSTQPGRPRAGASTHAGPAGAGAAERRSAALARKQARGQRPGDAAARRDQILHSGILEFFRTDVPDSAIATLLSSDSALGDDPRSALGVLDQARMADGYDIGALHVSSTGVGGAGTGEATIGAGGLTRIGLGVGHGAGPDRGGSIGRLAIRRERPLDVVAERPAVRGSLDREIIRRVVRRHINEIRYCYEQELPRAPSLAGRVAVRFTIAGSGAVAAALVDSSSLASPRVETCTVDAVRRWAFPPPQGGGIVIATYPFTFVPAGSGP